MTTKNLIINSENGTLTLNECSVNLLSEFLSYYFPRLSEEINKFNADSESEVYDELDKSYIPHLEKDVRPVVRLIRNLLDN